jgi:membrane protein DedA with SNARE-associated domain
MKSIIPIIAATIGIILFVLGLFFSGIYVSEAIFMRSGSNDQSLIFWYLPILFIGLAGLMAGVVLTLWARVKLRDREKTN